MGFKQHRFRAEALTGTL